MTVSAPDDSRRLRRLKIAGGVAFVLLLAMDLWTKAYMQDFLGLYEGHARGARELDVIPGFLAWQGTWNPGVTFGLVAHKTELILLLTGLATVLLLIWFLATRIPSRLVHFGLAMILAGAMGNLYDRLRFNQVRDFVLVYLGDLSAPSWTWPNFNVADSCIVVGVGFVMWDALFGLGSRVARARHQERLAARAAGRRP